MGFFVVVESRIAKMVVPHAAKNGEEGVDDHDKESNIINTIVVPPRQWKPNMYEIPEDTFQEIKNLDDRPTVVVLPVELLRGLLKTIMGSFIIPFFSPFDRITIGVETSRRTPRIASDVDVFYRVKPICPSRVDAFHRRIPYLFFCYINNNNNNNNNNKGSIPTIVEKRRSPIEIDCHDFCCSCCFFGNTESGKNWIPIYRQNCQTSCARPIKEIFTRWHVCCQRQVHLG
jgi:hypothetical protein